MKNIAICSLFRDSVQWHGFEIDQVNKFFKQTEKQIDKLGKNYNVSINVLENGSLDDTEKHIRLNQKKYPGVNFIKLSENFTSGSVASVSDSGRINTLGVVANIVFNFCKNLNPDYILWTESDLELPQEDTIKQLIDKLESDETISAISPVIFQRLGTIGREIIATESFDKLTHKVDQNYISFYDTWAYENKDGSRWTNQEPYNIEYSLTKERYMEMNSVGSLCIFRASHLKGASFDENAFRGLCSQIISQGGRILLDKDLEIFHPTNYYIHGRLV